MQHKIDATCAKATLFQRDAKLSNQLLHIAGNCLRRRDRLGKGAAHLHQFGNAHRLDRFASLAKSLSEPPDHFRAETQGQRRPWSLGKFAYGAKTEHLQSGNDTLLQPERRHRQPADRRPLPARRYDADLLTAKPGKRMGRPPAIGNSSAGGEACGMQAVDHAAQHQRLIAVQMVRTCRIQHQPIRRICGDDRGIDTQEMKSELLQGAGIRRRIQILDNETRHQSLRLADGCTGPDAHRLCCLVQCQHEAAASLTADHDQRLFNRRRVLPRKTPVAIRRPCRQVKRDDPLHHRLPLQMQRFRRRDIAKVPETSVACPPPAPAGAKMAGQRHASG
ncbi:hypothetical protein D3C87_1221510 [compost metagenome]